MFANQLFIFINCYWYQHILRTLFGIIFFIDHFIRLLNCNQNYLLTDPNYRNHLFQLLQWPQVNKIKQLGMKIVVMNTCERMGHCLDLINKSSLIFFKNIPHLTVSCTIRKWKCFRNTGTQHQ